MLLNNDHTGVVAYPNKENHMSAFKRTLATAVAALATVSLVALGTAPAQAAVKPLKFGAIIPLTGGLAFLSPPEIAGLHLAVDEINAAGGVLGKKVSLTIKDSGDATNFAIADGATTETLASGAQVVIGAASSSVTEHIINRITSKKVVQISMSNTDPALTTWKDGGYYFRTAPSDLLQGKVLGNQLLLDGKKKVAVIYQNSPYGKGLNGVIAKTLKAGKAAVTSFSFVEAETNFTSIVASALAIKPDAVVVVSYDEFKKAAPALKDAGYDGSKVYLVDGNLSDYSKESFGAWLKDAKGTNPGKATSAAFKTRLENAYKKYEGGKSLDILVYGAETYDAVILAALAAQAAGNTTGKAIKSKLTDISKAGAGKVKVTSFKAGLKALKAGKKINYDGYSGPIEFDKYGDPTGAFIGIYKYGTDGTNTLVRTVAANSVK
jgi:branched-chain amino acid transport system substrate-binding protein